MVITIEGGSEDKVKELARFIEAKLGVTRCDKAGTQVVSKEESKKEVKK